MINIIAKYVFLVCGLVSLVVVIIGVFKAYKIKKERKKRFGYDTLTNKLAVNTLKTKVRNQVKLGSIPSVFEELYNGLSIDSPTKNAKFLNKLVKKYRKKKRYYLKNVQENMNCNLSIKIRYSQFKGEKK